MGLRSKGWSKKKGKLLLADILKYFLGVIYFFVKYRYIKISGEKNAIIKSVTLI